MAENRLLQGKPSNSTPESPSQEEQLRHALEMMGGRRLGNAVSAPRPASAQNGQRHRYVRDGEVPVVHATLGRTAAKPEAAAQQEKALADFLRGELERERTARETAERSLHDSRASLTALQTRCAHLEMDLQAAQEHATGLLAQVSLLQSTPPPEPPPPATPRQGRPRIARQPRECEPEPVKWWIKTERS